MAVAVGVVTGEVGVAVAAMVGGDGRRNRKETGVRADMTDGQTPTLPWRVRSAAFWKSSVRCCVLADHAARRVTLDVERA